MPRRLSSRSAFALIALSSFLLSGCQSLVGKATLERAYGSGSEDPADVAVMSVNAGWTPTGLLRIQKLTYARAADNVALSADSMKPTANSDSALVKSVLMQHGTNLQRISNVTFRGTYKTTTGPSGSGTFQVAFYDGRQGGDPDGVDLYVVDGPLEGYHFVGTVKSGDFKIDGKPVPTVTP